MHKPNEEALFQHAMEQFPDRDALVLRTKLDLLAESPSVSLSDIPDIFAGPVTIQCDKSVLNLRIQPWVDEIAPLPANPVLAQVTDIFGASDSNLRLNQWLILDGAAVEHTMRPQDIGTIAKNCNLSFRTAKVQVIKLSNNPDDALKQLEGLEERLQTGWVRYRNGHYAELVPSSNSLYTPPVRQVLYGLDEKPLFDKSTPPEVS